MTIFLFFTFFLLIPIGLIISKFDKKYKNTEIADFINTCFKFSFWLLPFIWFVFSTDIGNPQCISGCNGSAILGAAILLLLSPAIVIASFLIVHILFISLFMLIHFSIATVFKLRVPFLTIIILTTFIMTVFLQLIWWNIFYTEISLPIRVYTWALLILIAPWLPIIATLIRQKFRRTKNPKVY